MAANIYYHPLHGRFFWCVSHASLITKMRGIDLHRLLEIQCTVFMHLM